MKGTIQTVLGPIEPGALGRCLPHEHLLHDLPLRVFLRPLPASIKSAEPGLQSTDDPFTSLERLGYVRQYPYSFEVNIEFRDQRVRAAVSSEMKLLTRMGGGAVVDNCSVGLRAEGHLQHLRQLSQESGIHIIAGTGYYVHDSQSPSVLNMSTEEMADAMLADLTREDNPRCGVIGEMGCSWPLHEFEKRSLVSSACIQEQTGCPVILHPGRDQDCPEEMIRIFREAGGQTKKTVMSHLERTFPNMEKLLDFASETDCYCELDLFGVEVSHYQCAESTDMPSDAQRVGLLGGLKTQGQLERILISQDIHTRHRLMAFGGHGYSHVLMNVVPKMRHRGFTEEDLDQILIDNPRRWLTFS